MTLRISAGYGLSDDRDLDLRVSDRATLIEMEEDTEKYSVWALLAAGIPA